MMNTFASAEKLASWPERVLITNDNGIEDYKLVALAETFASFCETWVVAPADNQSDTAHLLLSAQRGELRVERRDLAPDIRAYAVDDFPADCVVLALAGLMGESPPDLVISGINGGPNLAHDWLYSGTIGAARMAAFSGIPALAVSGLKSGIPEALAAATRWVAEPARSALVRNLTAGQYLTVSLPRWPPAEIKGVRVARRAGLRVEVKFTPQQGGVKNDV